MDLTPEQRGDLYMFLIRRDLVRIKIDQTKELAKSSPQAALTLKRLRKIDRELTDIIRPLQPPRRPRTPSFFSIIEARQKR